MASTKKRDLMDANPKTGGGDKLPKLEEMFTIAKLGKDYTQMRLVGGFVSFSMFWIKIKGSKSGELATIPRVCLDYNPDTDSYDDNGCPYRKAGLKPQIHYLYNVIDREVQDDLGKKKTPKYSKEEIKAGFLLPNTKSKSPVRVVKLPPGQIEKLKKFSSLNKVKDKKKGNKAVSIVDDKYGIDLNISFDKDAKGNNYDIQKAERTPLTDVEKEYLLWNIESLNEIYKAKSLSEAKADFKELKKVMVDKLDGDEEDSDYSKDDSKKSKKKGKKKGSEESESELSESENSESESEVKSKNKSKSKKKNKKDSEESESEVSESEESESESEVKSKKKKGKKKDSEESESESSESEESESEVKSSKKGKKKKDSEESESEGSESEESESESEVKSKKKGKKKDSEESESEESESEESESESEVKKPKKKGKKK